MWMVLITCWCARALVVGNGSGSIANASQHHRVSGVSLALVDIVRHIWVMALILEYRRSEIHKCIASTRFDSIITLLLFFVLYVLMDN